MWKILNKNKDIPQREAELRDTEPDSLASDPGMKSGQSLSHAMTSQGHKSIFIYLFAYYLRQLEFAFGLFS